MEQALDLKRISNTSKKSLQIIRCLFPSILTTLIIFQNLKVSYVDIQKISIANVIKS